MHSIRQLKQLHLFMAAQWFLHCMNKNWSTFSTYMLVSSGSKQALSFRGCYSKWHLLSHSYCEYFRGGHPLLWLDLGPGNAKITWPQATTFHRPPAFVISARDGIVTEVWRQNVRHFVHVAVADAVVVAVAVELKRKLVSCRHCQELSQLADLELLPIGCSL